MRSYKNFRDFANRPSPPGDADTVLLRGALFRLVETFGLYLAHVMKAAILLGHPTDWPTLQAKSVANGLRRAVAKSFPFENFTMASDLMSLLKFAKLATDFGLSAPLSFLLILRVPSETLLARRASDEDRLTEFAPRDFKILSGIRPSNGSGLLIAKFTRWENIPGVVFCDGRAYAGRPRYWHVSSPRSIRYGRDCVITQQYAAFSFGPYPHRSSIWN